MLEAPNATKTCLCFTRRILKLEETATCKTNHIAHKYIDVTPSKCSLDKDSQNLLNVLKNGKIPEVLPDERNSEFFEVDWPRNSTSEPNEDPEYLQRFCSTFYDKMKWLIIRSVMYMDSIHSGSSNVVEILQHLTTCTSRSHIFRGREDVLQRIKNYLQQPLENKPLVVYGQSGSGKTSVLAKSASMVRLWKADCSPVLIMRFLGMRNTCCTHIIYAHAPVFCW